MTKRKVARWDYGHRDLSKPNSVKIQSYDFQSSREGSPRLTDRYADNAMYDPADTTVIHEDADDSLLERLYRRLLTHRDATPEMIRAGEVELKPKGRDMLAAEFGISPEEIDTLMNSLPGYLERQEDSHMIVDDELMEYAEEDDDPRYTFESDFLGNIVIYDHYLRGSEPLMLSGDKALGLIRALEEHRGHREQQHILKHALAENLEEADDGLHPDFEFTTEIKNDAGMFNFPWSLGSHHGTGTASYRGDGQDFELNIEDVRNDKGKRINDLSDELIEHLKEQAVAFIPDA